MSKRIYIAGKVSDPPAHEEVKAFMDAESMIRSRGDSPVNPIRFCSSSWTWERCMRECLKQLSECDGIYMLKGWRSSRGAKLEHFVALKLKMEVEVQR